MHTVFNVISIIRCNGGWFVTTSPCCILSATTRTCNVESLFHVRNKIFHCFLHHCRHITGIISIDRQVVLHKSDGHQLSLVTDNNFEQLVIDNDIFGRNVCQLDQNFFSICSQFWAWFLSMRLGFSATHNLFVCACGCFF